MIMRIGLFMGLLLALSACGGGDTATNAGAPNSAQAGSVDVRVRTESGEQHRFTAELAIGPEAQQRGLMGRTTLAEDAGMLFPFAYPNMASFWMKETLIPLDLLFIRADGTIAAILQGEPESLLPLASNEPVIAVLEIGKGRAQALGIGTGDHVEWGDCRDGESPPDVWRADRFCPPAAP